MRKTRMRNERIQQYRKKMQLQRLGLIIQMIVIIVLFFFFVHNKVDSEKNSGKVVVVDGQPISGETGQEGYKDKKSDEFFSDNQVTGEDYPSAEELGIDLFHPVKYEGKKLAERLKQLAELSDDYNKIWENRKKLSDDLLSAVCNNPEILSFALSLLEEIKELPALSPVQQLTEEEKTAEGIPLLLQFDERWGACGYGGSMVAISGCAPTCMSMVIIGLLGDTSATPDVVAAYTEKNGFYLAGIGTDWSFMTKGAEHFGLNAKEVSLDEEMVLRELRQGHPIICSMRKGTFTSEGHFIVLAGVEDGKIQVRDPNSKRKSEMLWDFSELESQIKNLWRYRAE